MAALPLYAGMTEWSDCNAAVDHSGTGGKAGQTFCADTVMEGDVRELPEVVVESRGHRVLHMLAYVREYSTMTTYTDTVFLFREKTVDYMVPSDSKVRFRGWTSPRILTCRSYYRFTDSDGLDSVSDAGNHHFSWSDWIGVPPKRPLPDALRRIGSGTDTLYGRYSPAEIWTREDDHVVVTVDVLADTLSRGWVPDMSGFFRSGVDFERFRIWYDYSNVVGDTLSVTDITGYSFHIESNGRGREMFRFNRRDEPFFVSTEAEVYILDKEYITVSEARKWERGKFDTEEIGIYESPEAPDLPPEVQELVDRVAGIDKDSVRLDYGPDYRMVSRNDGRRNFRIGRRALLLLKQATGITRYRFNRNLKETWNEFRKDRLRRDR